MNDNDMKPFFDIELRLYSNDKTTSEDSAQVSLQSSSFWLNEPQGTNRTHRRTLVCEGNHTKSRALAVRGICLLFVFWKLCSHRGTLAIFQHKSFVDCLYDIKPPDDANSGLRYKWVSQFFGKKDGKYLSFKDFFDCTKNAISPYALGGVGIPPINIKESKIKLDGKEASDPVDLLSIYRKLQVNEELKIDNVALGEFEEFFSSNSNRPNTFQEDIYRTVSGGALDDGNQLYIERPFENDVKRLLEAGGATIKIRAPRKFGKTSLFVRMRNWKMVRSRLVITLDFQSLDLSRVPTTDALFSWLHSCLHGETNTPVPESNLSENGKHVLTNILRDRLRAAKAGVVLLIDEPDRLFKIEQLCSEFFSLLRFWHNQRAFYPDLWNRLDIVFSYTSDPDLWIRDVNQSPFNVAYGVDIDAFSSEQISELVKRHPDRDTAAALDGAAIHEWTGGHPYLTQLLMEATRRCNDLQFAVTQAFRGEDHAGRYLRARFALVHHDPTLRDAMRTIFLGNGCEDHFAFETLWSMGLVCGASRRSCEVRCRLFAEYFQREFL